MMTANEYFICIDKLREAIQGSNHLKIVHSHKIWIASFKWYDPVPVEEIRIVENQLEQVLPDDYKVFLTSISNGAILYHDIDYGQWGYKIYGVDNLIKKQVEWKEIFNGDWQPHYLVIGEFIGESHALILDLSRPSKDGKGFTILDGNPIDPPSYWENISQSFHDWLDNLIDAQGAKYWLWV